MHHDAKTYLWDIQNATDAILRFVAGLDAQEFEAAELVHSAVERKFEIIGEALRQLARLDPHLASRIPDMRDIIAFRNILIHGYAVVEHNQVWRIAQSSLPNLKVAVAALLAELGPTES